jgi:hypothetical protein
MYHLTRAANFKKVLQRGLKANECKKSFNSGPGVYLYDDINASTDIRDYIHKSTDGTFIIIEVSIPNDAKLLMDEDALGRFGSQKLNPAIEAELPEHVVMFYNTKLVETGDSQQAKILTIDQYQIRPSSEYKTPISKSRVLTARYDDSIPPNNIIRIFGLDNYMDKYPILYENGVINRKEVSEFNKYNK